MTATYTFDVFASLDGYGSYTAAGDWGGHWGTAGPEFLAHRTAQFGAPQRMVFGANTYREFIALLGADVAEADLPDAWVAAMRRLPTTVVSSTLTDPLHWPHAEIASGDAVDVVARLKEEFDVLLRSHGSLSMNWALLAAGLVDEIQLTVFPILTGRTGCDPVFGGAGDYDLELLESRVLDGRIQETRYRPTAHP